MLMPVLLPTGPIHLLSLAFLRSGICPAARTLVFDVTAAVV